MVRAEEQAVLDAISGKSSHGRVKLRANCPFCITVVGKEDRKQCLELNLLSGWWKCYRCDHHGHLDEVPYDTSTLAAQHAAPSPAVVEAPLPEGFCGLWAPEHQKSLVLAPARAMLKSRVGVTKEIVKAAQIGAVFKNCIKNVDSEGTRLDPPWRYNPFHERVVVPLFKNGVRVGFVGRSWQKNPQRKYLYSEGFKRSAVMYNEEALYVPTDIPVVAVEGVFDTYPFWRKGQPLSDGVAMLGKTSPEQFEMLLKARRPIIIAWDGDAHRDGEGLAMQLQMYGKVAISARLPPGRDPDEEAKAIIQLQRTFAQLVSENEVIATDTVWRLKGGSFHA